MTEYKKYPQYKDSGVEWLGQIPQNWKSAKLLHVADFNSGSTPDTDNLSFWDFQGNGIPWVAIGDMSGDKTVVQSSKKHLTEEGVKSKNLKILPAGTILFAMYASVGEVAILDLDATCNQALLGISPKKNMDSKFCFYALKAINSWLPNLYRSSTQNNLNAEQVKGLKLPFPHLKTQQKIVEFLDKETSHIDAGIAHMESLIALLTEKRAALISETVTRGIPGEHTEFKDSGVDWLGEIPESRKLVITGRILKAQKEVVGANHIEYDLLSLTKKGVIFRDKNSGIGKFPESFDTYQVVHPENLVFCLFDTEETPRTIGLVHQEGMITGAYTRFVVNKSLAKPEFLENYFIAIDDKKGFKPLYTGLRKTIQKPRFLASKVPLPSLEEQDRIVSYIKKNTKEIDLAITNAKSVIKLMKEKRQVLISDAVTGKINVSDEVN
jgi:type I restriction enzyme S subunit